MTTDPDPLLTDLLLTNLQSRRDDDHVVSLDGTWKLILDPYDSGLINILGERNKTGYFRDFKPRHQGDRVEYDFDTSTDIEVPGDWNTQHPELLYYEGTAWYRRLIEVDDDHAARASAGRSFVHFGAANHTTRVFLDGEELALHEGGFGPFTVEVTGRLSAGTHSLVVMVNNRREPDRIPAMRSDWWNFGGIHRSVELVHTPATSIIDAWLTMAPDGCLTGGVTVDGPEAWALEVRVSLGDEVIADVANLADGEQPIDPPSSAALGFERWAPGAPVLHRATWTLHNPDTGAVVDEVHDDIGLRTVRVDGTTLYINDVETYLNGISIHGEGPSGGSRAAGEADASELLDWAEALNANFVRLAHYQHDEAMVREADRRGLLAWGELPVYWGIDFENPATIANARRQADELVVRDRNRASMILWSAANETLPGDGRNSFITTIIERFRALDPTRLTTAALLTLPTNSPNTLIDDPLGEVVDVIGVNEYLGWYYGDREAIPETTWSSTFNKPLVFSELGAGAKFGHHGSDDEIWTEEFQAAVYRAQLEMINRQSECIGLSPWILKDFRTPMRVLPGIQDGYNRKGLVSEEGERKLAFELLADWYKEQP